MNAKTAYALAAVAVTLPVVFACLGVKSAIRLALARNREDAAAGALHSSRLEVSAPTVRHVETRVRAKVESHALSLEAFLSAVAWKMELHSTSVD